MSKLIQKISEMNECQKVSKKLQSYLDSELTPELAVRVSKHLDLCLKCGMKYESYSRIKKALATAAIAESDSNERQLAVERLRRFAINISLPEKE